MTRRLLTAVAAVPLVAVVVASTPPTPPEPEPSHVRTVGNSDWSSVHRRVQAMATTTTTIPVLPDQPVTGATEPSTIDIAKPSIPEAPAATHDHEDTSPPLGSGHHHHEDKSPAAGTGAGNTSGVDINCESGGNYAANNGNGYYGAYQFDRQTWQAAGGSTATADQASPAEQDAVAASWVASGHRGAWPNC